MHVNIKILTLRIIMLKQNIFRIAVYIMPHVIVLPVQETLIHGKHLQWIRSTCVVLEGINRC